MIRSSGATNYCLDSQVLDFHDQQLYGEMFAQNYQSGTYQFDFSSWEDLQVQPSKIPSPLDEIEFTSLKKRSIENINSFCERDRMNVNEIGNEGKRSKRRKSTSSLQQWHHHSSNIEEQNESQEIPMRRSQKLNNKITALQKLVSPYGKTDTASVLEEASLYIKLLQQQIQNLYGMLNKSCSSQEINGKLVDLESGGVCLFPMSVLQKWSNT